MPKKATLVESALQVVCERQIIQSMPQRFTPSPAQLRAARALLNIGRDDLAKLSGVSERAIGNYEMERSKFIRSNREAVRKALEQLGVEFLEGDGVKRRED